MTELYIDASAMKKSYCTRAYQLGPLQGHTAKRSKGPLVFGKAVHQYVKDKTTGVSFEDAMDKAHRYFLDKMGADLSEAGKLVGAMTSFMEEPLFGQLLTPEEPALSVERFFKILIYEVEDTQVFLVGTIDRLAIINDHLVAIDWKTSRIWDKERILGMYETSVQFMLYYYVLKVHPTAVIPPEYLHWADKPVFVCPCPVLLSNKPSPRWIRGPMLQFDDQLEEFVGELSRTVSTILAMHQDGLGTLNAPLAAPSGMINDACPDCDFKPVCFRPRGVEAQEILKLLFTQETYDPSKF